MLNLEVKIKDLLTKKNMSQKELCSQIEMSDQNLRIIFKRNSIETKHLEKIAEVLEVPVTYFFEEGSEPGPVVTKKTVSQDSYIAQLESENRKLLQEISQLKDKIINLIEKL